MLRELLDREGWKGAPVFAVLAAVLWPIVCIWGDGLVVAAFAMLSGIMAIFGVTQRATAFEAALPIPGRQLVAARLLAMLAVFGLPALVMAIETLIFRGWEDTFPLLDLWAFSMSLVLAGQSIRIREIKAPSWTMLVAAGAYFGLAFDPGFLPHGALVLGICLAAIAILIARLWMGVPDCFQLAPANPVRARRFALRRPSWLRTGSPVWWLAWRSTLAWGNLFIGPLAVWLWGSWGFSLLAGPLAAKPGLSACQRLEWLCVLPISRRRLLPMVMIPWLAILIVFLSLSHLKSAPQGPMVSMGYSGAWQQKAATGSGTPNVLVPATFWRWAWAWEAPVIRSPSGETTRPKTFLRLGFSTYNPYSVAPDNSARFLDWQLSRATEAVYGRAGLRKPEPLRLAWLLRQRSVELQVATVGFLGMYWLTFWLKVRGHATDWALVPWICLVALFVWDVIFTPRPIATSGPLSEIVALRLAAILPQNPAALAVVAALLLGGLYWAAEKQFDKVDLIAPLRPADNS